MFTYHISRLPSKTLYKINMYKCGKSLGNMNFQIENNIAVLNNLEVNIKNTGYGSHFLNIFEKYVKYKYNVYEVHLLAWQPYSGENVINFFQKNGYYNLAYKGVYDDSVTMFDLFKMRKYI